jgi:hypothetical protein
MPSSRRSAAIIVVVSLASAVVLFTDSKVVDSVGVVCIGVGGLVQVAKGKPRWSGFGLTEALVHRLPEAWWRAVMTVLSVVIIIFGLWPWLR